MTYQPPSPQGPYQPPYPPPPMGFDYYAPQQADPLAPARRASTTMYVIGGLILLAATCFGVTLAMLPELMKQPEFAQTMAQTPGFTPEHLRIGLVAMTAISGVLGLCTVLLAVFVRRGGRGAVITSLVLASLVVLFLAFQLVTIVASAGQMPPPALALSGCFFVLPLVLFALLLTFLIQANRAAGQVKAMREQYTQQYWQYAYQQQQYQQPQGYPQQMPPPPAYPPPPRGPGERSD